MIAIVKYNAGNIKSVENAVKKLGYQVLVTDNPNTIYNAKKVIFPGVGEASSAMQYLKKKKLDTVIKSLTQPVLGICLGLQLLCENSEEGNTACLGVFKNEVKRFPAKGIVPHMGWNNFQKTDGQLLKNILSENDVYFVHSYYATINETSRSVCEYVVPFSATLEKDNFFATQFHPEKSGEIGIKILQNFLAQ